MPVSCRSRSVLHFPIGAENFLEWPFGLEAKGLFKRSAINDDRIFEVIDQEAREHFQARQLCDQTRQDGRNRGQGDLEATAQIGRASCREREEISGVAVSLKKK